MMCTTPNVAHAMGFVCRFLTNPSKEQWLAVLVVKWILQYLGERGRKKCAYALKKESPC